MIVFTLKDIVGLSLLGLCALAMIGLIIYHFISSGINKVKAKFTKK